LLYAPIFLCAASVRFNEVEAHARAVSMGLLLVETISDLTRRRPPTRAARHSFVKGILLGTEADPENRVTDFARSVSPSTVMVPLPRRQLTGDELHESRLACAVRAPSKPVIPGGQLQGHVVQPDDLTVPFRQVVRPLSRSRPPNLYDPRNTLLRESLPKR